MWPTFPIEPLPGTWPALPAAPALAVVVLAVVVALAAVALLAWEAGAVSHGTARPSSARARAA